MFAERRRLATLIALLVAGAACAGRGEAPPGAAAPRYTFPDAESVFDTKTRLTWQRAGSAQTFGWAEAMAACAASPGWRLPSMKELQTLVDFGRSVPAIDLTAFPGTAGDPFWTSTPSVTSSADAWFVDFWLGAANTGTRTSPKRARCTK